MPQRTPKTTRMPLSRVARKERSHANGALSRWFAQIARTPLLSADEERTLARRARAGDEAAYQQLVQANLRLVVRVASGYAHGSMPFLDLIQEGNVGLMTAARRFDPERGHRFSTYAVWWIRRAILRALAYDSRLIRLPEHILELRGRLERIAAALSQQYGREPSSEEVALAAGTTTEHVALALDAPREVVSLDAELPLPGNPRYRDVIEDPRHNPARYWERHHAVEETERLLATLSLRQRAVLRARFGLETGQPLTLKEMSAQFNLSRERIRQIERDALEALRRQIRQESNIEPVTSSV